MFKTHYKKQVVYPNERVNYLEESGGIGNIISHPALSGNANLILIYWRFRLRLLNPLVPIHLLHRIKLLNKNTYLDN